MYFPTPIYRFFNKKEYLNELVDEGIMRFTPVHAFTTLDDDNYRDEGERYYNIKTVRHHTKVVAGKKLLAGSIDHQYRPISDAWAFCGTTSIVSSARKPFCAFTKDIPALVTNLKGAILQNFGEDLPIWFGPIAYYEREMDLLSEVIQPPYFTKPEKFKGDLEFRIVIIPSDRILDLGPISPLNLRLKNPDLLFGKTTILDPKRNK